MQSASPMTTYRPRMNGSASMYARPRPRLGVLRTLAPPARASSAVASSELSTIRISPRTPASLQALVAPLDEVGDRRALVERGDDDRQLGVALVLLRDGEAHVAVGDSALARGAFVAMASSSGRHRAAPAVRSQQLLQVGDAVVRADLVEAFAHLVTPPARPAHPARRRDRPGRSRRRAATDRAVRPRDTTDSP